MTTRLSLTLRDAKKAKTEEEHFTKTFSNNYPHIQEHIDGHCYTGEYSMSHRVTQGA